MNAWYIRGVRTGVAFSERAAPTVGICHWYRGFNWSWTFAYPNVFNRYLRLEDILHLERHGLKKQFCRDLRSLFHFRKIRIPLSCTKFLYRATSRNLLALAKTGNVVWIKCFLQRWDRTVVTWLGAADRMLLFTRRANLDESPMTLVLLHGFHSNKSLPY